MYPSVFQMELTMKYSVQVVTAGVLVDRDQLLVGVRQEDGHGVPLEVSRFLFHLHLEFKTVFNMLHEYLFSRLVFPICITM